MGQVGETAAVVGSAIAGGTLADMAKIGGFLNPFVSIEETEAADAVLREQLQVMPSEGNEMAGQLGEIVQGQMGQVGTEISDARRQLNLEDEDFEASIPGRIFDALPPRLQGILRTTIGI